MSSLTTACPQCAREYANGEIFCATDGARLIPLRNGFGSSAGPDPLLGQTLVGRYRILRKIGEGGMGIVYEAIHVMIEKSVALKVLREDFSHREDVVERFRQEAKSASRIGHQHIIDISDFGVTPSGAHFFVMELLLGRDLAEELELRGPLPTRRAMTIGLQCAKALEAAHAKGIVHRDMKPENVFLLTRDTGEDFIKIVDFGIAKMSDIDAVRASPGRKTTNSGTVFGTPEYMSPEQAAGKPLDHRVDVYALGIILYELLTGRVPFMGDTFMGILTQHMFEPAQPLSVAYPACSAPRELEQLVMRALAKDENQRPQTMTAFAAELAQLLAMTSPSSSPPPPGTFTHLDMPPVRAASARAGRSLSPTPFASHAPQTRQKPLVRWALAGVAVLTLLALGLFVGWRRGGASHEPARVVAPPPLLPASVVAPPPLLPASTTVHDREEPPSKAASAPSQSATAGEGSAEVAVEVRSEPSGATVSVDGHRACSATPCRFQAHRGAGIQVVVQKAGFRSGRTSLTPTRDLNRLELTLSRRREGARGGNRMDGDLMLPDAFGKR